MKMAWYNEQGLEACPKCHERGSNLKAVTVDVAPPESGRRYMYTMRCSTCRLQFQFYQDEPGVSLNALPKEKKAPEAYKPVLPDISHASFRHKSQKRITELAEEIAHNIHEQLG